MAKAEVERQEAGREAGRQAGRQAGNLPGVFAPPEVSTPPAAPTEPLRGALLRHLTRDMRE